jgi:hypothetical protein
MLRLVFTAPNGRTLREYSAPILSPSDIAQVFQMAHGVLVDTMYFDMAKMRDAYRSEEGSGSAG